MRVGYRNTDSRVPFFWESSAQPPARWHGVGEGPCQYLADTPDGAWAEFLRHEEITDPADLDGITRSLWAVELPDSAIEDATPAAAADMRGGPDSYPACRAHARELRAAGVTEMTAPSAALMPGGAGGQVTRRRTREASGRDGTVWVLFGRRPDVRGFRVVARGRPDERVLAQVSPLAE